MPGQHHRGHVGVDGAEPVELEHIELHRRAVQERGERHTVFGEAELGAVVGSRAVEIGREPQSPAAGHVLHHDGGAGQMLGEIARQHAGVRIVAAARAGPDQDGDGLALERLGGECLGRKACRAPMGRPQQHADERERNPADRRHGASSHRSCRAFRKPSACSEKMGTGFPTRTCTQSRKAGAQLRSARSLRSLAAVAVTLASSAKSDRTNFFVRSPML